MSTVSARPGRLTRFESVATTMADSMQTRVRSLETAIVSYEGGCDHRFRVDVGDLPPALRASLEALAELGRWTGDVGRGFLAADVVDAYVHGGSVADEDGITTIDEDAVVGHVRDDGWDDPFLGAPAVGFPAGTGDPEEEPPSWLELAQEGGDALGYAEALVAIANNIDELPTEYPVRGRKSQLATAPTHGYPAHAHGADDGHDERP